MKPIPYGRQYIDSQDIKFVSKALKEDLITTGGYVKKFENKISKFLKVKYAVSCSSGTSALHLALMAINLKKDEVIIMPAINFIAVYNMARLMNAKIFLADVDPLTGQMTPETLLECIKNNKLKRIKAIVTMYLGGYPENVIEFYNIKKKYKCFLIEDACHAFGARYKYRNKKFYIGGCKHSDLATFSFHPVKTLTTGEGGIVTTNNKVLANKVLLLRSHGIKRKKNKHWEYNIQNLGFNYRLSDINSALGLSQLSKIKKFINFRRKIYKSYQKFLINNPNIILPKYNKKNDSAFHLFLISIKSNSKLIKNKLFNFLIKSKIFAQYHYVPIYRFSCFKEKLNYKKFSNSEYYYRNSLSIPFFYNLSLKNQNYVLKKIKIFFEYLK
jgi:dTDP-4-amino-4,6-dideoxygalactose transaminase